jgi:hypothetical protein
MGENALDRDTYPTTEPERSARLANMPPRVKELQNKILGILIESAINRNKPSILKMVLERDYKPFNGIRASFKDLIERNSNPAIARLILEHDLIDYDVKFNLYYLNLARETLAKVQKEKPSDYRDTEINNLTGLITLLEATDALLTAIEAGDRTGVQTAITRGAAVNQKMIARARELAAAATPATVPPEAAKFREVIGILEG